MAVRVIDTPPPSVALTSPADRATVSGSAVTVAASASDNVAIQRIEFYRDSDVLLETDSSAPYSILWNSTTVTDGSHTLYAKAVDTTGNWAISPVRTVTVLNALAPTVSITSPTNGATVPRRSTVTIRATASENVSITKVEFYVNGTRKYTDTTADYSCAWSVPAQAGGTYRLWAKAYDAKRNVVTSSVVTVTSR